MNIKNVGAKILFIIIVGSSMVLPLVASAAAYTTPNIWGTPPGYWGPLVSCTGNYLPNGGGQIGTIPNQCTSLCDLIDTFINIVYFGMSVAIFILAPIMIVVGGIMIMFAGANPGMLESGKKALTATIVGLIIVLCAYLIVNTFVSVVKITGVGGFGSSSCATSS